MLYLFILFTTNQNHILLNELVLNKKINLAQGIEQLTKINADFKKTADRLLIMYKIYFNVTDEQAFVSETIALPVVEETVLQNIVQTVEINEEIRQEDLEAFLRLFKRNVSNKNKQKRKGRSTVFSKKGIENQQKLTVFTTITRYSYFSVALLVFLAVGVFAGATFSPQKTTNQNDSKLEERLTRLQEQLNEEPQVDVVARFFLSSLYSGEESDKATQKQVKKYVSEGVLKEIKGSKEQIRTLFLWESKKEGNQWLLTYVVTLKVTKEETEIRQVKVAMERKNNSYQVTELPEATKFSINE